MLERMRESPFDPLGLRDMVTRDLDRVLGGVPTPKEMTAVRAQAVSDVAGYLLGQIPLVGVVLSDALGDNISADFIAPNLSPRQKELRMEIDRVTFPDTVSVIEAIRRSKM